MSIQARHDASPIQLMSNSSSSSQGVLTTPSIDSLDSRQTCVELNALRLRIAELEEKLSQSESNATTTPVHLVSAAVSPIPTRPVETSSSFVGIVDVLQDNRAFTYTTAISRAVAHKNRVFGQSHWMNGFLVYRDLIELIEPIVRAQPPGMLSDMHRAKNLARAIKKQRSPVWPTSLDRELPAREICDELVDGYLRTVESLYRILHVPSFQREYEDMWTSGAERNMAFMVQLKLVMAIGATVFDENFSMRKEATHWIYEAQTWLSAPTFKSRLGIQYLQNNILLLLARNIADVGSELVWISAGSVLRAAIYIGLHKDPSRLPRISPFESEMRRRLWNTMLEVLLQSSLESGGPALLSLDDFDTAAPGNYDDDALTTMDSNTYPSSEHTQTSISIALRSTFAARLAVVKFLNDNTSPGTFEQTLRLDADLRSSHKTLRRILQGYDSVRKMTSSSPSSSFPVLSFGMQAADFIMQRYISSLHYPFFSVALREPLYAYSRKTVIDASLKIWLLACSSTDTNLPTRESDLSRFCRCGSGFFGAFAFHAAATLGAEARARVEDEEEELNPTSQHSMIMNIVEDAAEWYLSCMRGGETSLKGYLLLKLLSAQIDGIRRHVDLNSLPITLTQVASVAVKTCLNILELKAGTDQNSTFGDGSGDGGIRIGDFELLPESTEYFDSVMSDVLNFGNSLDFFALF